jgi:hypothetical protein
MRPGKGVENCLNAKDSVAGMAGRAQLDVTGSMLVNVFTKMRGIENQLRRRAGQLLLGSSAHPTRQDGSGFGNLTRELIAAVGDFRRLSFGFDDIGGHASARGELCQYRLSEKLIFALELVEQRAASFEEITVEPGNGRIPAHCQDSHAPFGFGSADGRVSNGSSQVKPTRYV